MPKLTTTTGDVPLDRELDFLYTARKKATGDTRTPVTVSDQINGNNTVTTTTTGNVTNVTTTGVLSLNTLTGNVTIAPGTQTTVTQVGNVITVDSTAGNLQNHVLFPTGSDTYGVVCVYSTINSGNSRVFDFLAENIVIFKNTDLTNTTNILVDVNVSTTGAGLTINTNDYAIYAATSLPGSTGGKPNRGLMRIR